MSQGYSRRHRAMVITPRGVFTSDGHTYGPPNGEQLASIGTLLDGALRTFGEGEGVLMIAGITREQLAPSLDQFDTCWTHAPLRPWTSFRHDRGPIIHLALYDEMDRRRSPLLFADEERTQPLSPDRVARNLGAFHHVIGTPWFATGGATGTHALRAQYTDPRPGRQPRWKLALPRGTRGVAPIIWDAPAPVLGKYVHHFDLNAAYLASLRRVELAWSRLTDEPRAFGADVAGYWWVPIDAIHAELLGEEGDAPPLISRRLARDGLVPLTTPVMVYLGQRYPDRPLPIMRSLTCPNTHPVTRQLAERLAAARSGITGPLPRPVLRSVKRVYAELTGMFGNESSRVARADWQHTTMDLTAVNMRRRLDRCHQLTGLWPIKIRTDAAWFTSDDPSPRRIGDALGTGTGPGLFRHEQTFTADEFADNLASAGTV